MTRKARIALLGAALTCAGFWATRAEPPPSPALVATQPAWAPAVQEPGLPNLHKVNDRLYRGAQPAPEGYKTLKSMGVKTVISLRTSSGDREPCEKYGLAFEHIPMKTWHPERQDVEKFLEIATNQDNAPVFVHCKHGADRTGMMCAIYRMAVEGWSKDQAIQEMTKGGFGFHPVWKNLIVFLRGLDVQKIRDGAELPERE